jgi:hypothetical protein
MLARLLKGVTNFLIEDFFDLPQVSTTLVVHLKLQISPRIFKKNFETVLVGYSGAGGKVIHEKNLNSKIS